MERLTMVGAGGGISEKTGVTRKMLCSRLAAYEDTELEPEDIKSIMDKYGRGFTAKTAAMDDLQAYRALGPVEELSALVKAKDEGRVVVKPWCGNCKYESSMAVRCFHCLGSQQLEPNLFEPRSEAEAALGGGGDG